MRALKIGDPLDETTEIGPLATEQILNGVHDQVQKSIAARRKIIDRRKSNSRPGIFLRANGACRCTERDRRLIAKKFSVRSHLFSACATPPTRSRLANDSTFGLGASAWTTIQPKRNFSRPSLDSGMVFINAHGRFRSATAIWRRETLRLRSRTWRRRDSGIYKRENNLDFVNSNFTLTLMRLIPFDDTAPVAAALGKFRP